MERDIHLSSSGVDALKDLWPHLNNIILLVWQLALPSPFLSLPPIVTHQAITLINDLQHPQSAQRHWQDLKSPLEMAFITFHLPSSQHPLACDSASDQSNREIWCSLWVGALKMYVLWPQYHFRGNVMLYLAGEVVNHVYLCFTQ